MIIEVFTLTTFMIYNRKEESGAIDLFDPGT
jgi:hypothetical protein